MKQFEKDRLNEERYLYEEDRRIGDMDYQMNKYFRRERKLELGRKAKHVGTTGIRSNRESRN